MQFMPPRSRLKLPPLDLGTETLGRRVARLRKDRGYTQVELAEKIGIIQELVLLGLKEVRANGGVGKIPRRVLRRVELIGGLPMRDQRALLNTIDKFVKAGHA
jgi:transcriptional regulator with XRE-family HTH domain